MIITFFLEQIHNILVNVFVRRRLSIRERGWGKNKILFVDPILGNPGRLV